MPVIVLLLLLLVLLQQLLLMLLPHPDEGIPDFWLTAMANHDMIGEYVTERDAEVRPAWSAALCYPMPCHAMPCHATLCHVRYATIQLQKLLPTPPPWVSIQLVHLHDTRNVGDDFMLLLVPLQLTLFSV
jgi:hypothetical protein